MGPEEGFVLWLTGLSGAGKSTLARELAGRLAPLRAVEILDGDEVRRSLCGELGFSKGDRDTNVRRIGYVARLLARNGVAVVVAAISPYEATRHEVRAAIEHEGVRFLEIFVDANVDVLIQRDTKGLYRRALEGQIGDFTGISAPYERPPVPDLWLRTDRESVGSCVKRIISALSDSRPLRPHSFSEAQ
jgi:adenylyl-sulfate kinase